MHRTAVFLIFREYIGGTYLNSTASNTADIVLAYQAPNWTSKKLAVLQVAATLLGKSGSAYGTDVTGPAFNRINNNFLNLNSFGDSAAAINYTFSDSGLFGIRVSGASSHVQLG